MRVRAPFTFRVKSTGSIPARIHVTQTFLPAPFRSMLGSGPSPVRDFTLRRNQSRTFAAGISWAELWNTNLGQSVRIIYTIRATPACT